MNGKPNKAITPESWANAQARYEAEVRANRQLKAMAKANELTVGEQSDLTDAEAAVLDKEAALEAAGVALTTARSTGFLGRETADLELLEQDLTEARQAHQNAVRRRNMLRRRIDAARAARRQAAKLKSAPALPPIKLRGDWWSSTDRLNGKDAA